MDQVCQASLRLSVVLLTVLLGVQAWAHEPRTKGQRVYVPIYSAIGYISNERFDLAVTLSLRNTDGETKIRIRSVAYFDTSGKRLTDLLASEIHVAPFGTHSILIKQKDMPGDIGGNVVVEWTAEQPVSPPILDAIMVGARGTQAFSFASRGVPIE